MMKMVIDAVSTVLAIILLIWFLASWMNVLACNGPSNSADPADWNAFVIMTEVVK